MINLADYDSIQSALNANKYVGGTLHIPAGVYVEDLIVGPHVNILGDGEKTVIDGDILWSSPMGNYISNIKIGDGTLKLVNCRSGVADHLYWANQEQPCVTLEGSTYYNTFRDCVFYGVGTGFQVNDLCNDNHIIGGRIYSNHCGVEFVSEAHNWTINGFAFEGRFKQNVIGSHLKLRGNFHSVYGCRFESGNGNTYDPAAVVLDSTTEKCRIIGGSRGWNFSVLDNGTDNILN